MSFKPIPNLSGTQANFTGNITSAGNLTVEGDITMGGSDVLTGVSESNVTQHQAALSITESQISDLGSYITSVRTVTAGGNTLGAGETLAFTAGSNMKITESAGAVTIAVDGSAELPTATIPNLAASKITSSTFANARISESSVTQHQAALTLASGQITGALGFTPISTETDDQTLDEVLAQGNTSSRNITAGIVTGSNGVRGQDVQIGVTDSAMIDTSAGDLDIGSAGGTTILGDTTISITNKLGIGTTSPSGMLHINDDAATGTGLKVTGGGSGGPLATFTRDVGSTGTIAINSAGGDPQISLASSSNTFALGTNGSSFEISDNDTVGTNTRLIIASDGDVGIGTASPSAKLDVISNHSQLRLEDSDDSKFVLFSYSGGSLVVRNNSTSTTTNQFTLTEAGKFGIGTTSPSHQLDVNGTLRSVGDATFDANVNAAGVITTGGNTEAEVKSWLHVGRMWSFNGLPGFSKDSGAAAARSDGVAPGSLSTGAAASRRAMMTLIRNTYNDYGGYSGAGPDYSRAIGASIKLAFFANGQNSSIVRLLVGSPSSVSSTPYADEDPLSNHGFGVEFRRGSGSTYEWRVFGHNGTSLTASAFTSTGITYTVDPRTIAVYSDGAGNITAYTALYGSTSYTTATTTGGPTATAGGMSTYTSIQVATNDSSYVSGASAKCVFMGANFYAE